MKKLFTTTAILFLLVLSASSQTIAVLPYKITYEGRIPKKYTPEQIATSIKNEGRNYQTSMINYLVKMNNKSRNKKMGLKIISQGQIDALLNEKGISQSKLDSMTNKQIAETLGVTYVVRGTASRNFIMSDELSMGISAVQIITNGSVGFITATSNVVIINALEDLETGNTEFSKQFNRVTSPGRSDEQNLRDVFRYSARKMMKAFRKMK